MRKIGHSEVEMIKKRTKVGSKQVLGLGIERKTSSETPARQSCFHNHGILKPRA